MQLQNLNKILNKQILCVNCKIVNKEANNCYLTSYNLLILISSILNFT